MLRSTMDVLDPPAGIRVCPACELARLRRSRTRPLERLLKPFTTKRPYACTACGWRGWTAPEETLGAAPADVPRPRRMLDPAAHTTIRPVAARPATSPLPVSVASQLGNLAQSLAVHPARPRTLALVSAGRGEGTSTLTVSLGRYLASRNARVLIVDTNPHHPALHVLAGVENSDGLRDVIDGRIESETAIKPTAVPGLFALPLGRSTERVDGPLLPPELRERLLLKCSARYDYVLMDCPPVNVYEDAASIASVCDGVILVIECGRTLRHAARTAKMLLTRANCNLLGVFMNKRKFYIPAFLYDRL